MARDGKELQTGRQAGNNLEAYRRLVELQRQMIEVAQQHEQSKRECEALRAQIAHEIVTNLNDKRLLHQRLRTAVSRLNWFNRKESLPC